MNVFDDKELKYLETKIYALVKYHWQKIIEQIFGCTLEKLANKLINTKSKEENQIIVKNIDKNRDKLYEQKRGDYVIQASDRRIDLIDAIKLIINFDETIQLDLVWKHKKSKNERMILIGGNNHKLLNTLCN